MVKTNRAVTAKSSTVGTTFVALGLAALLYGLVALYDYGVIGQPNSADELQSLYAMVGFFAFMVLGGTLGRIIKQEEGLSPVFTTLHGLLFLLQAVVFFNDWMGLFAKWSWISGEVAQHAGLIGVVIGMLYVFLVSQFSQD